MANHLGWMGESGRAGLDASVQVLDPQQHSATTQQTLASSLASQQSKKLKTNNIVIVILYARVSSTKQLRYNQNDRVRADTEHNNFECTWVEEHGAVDWEASMARRYCNALSAAADVDK